MSAKENAYERYGNFIINKSSSLGSGNYGNVWKGYLIGPNNTLEPVAIKESYNESQNIKEIQTLQVLKHPNIIRYRDYRISGNSVFMVMELCSGGTLDDLLFSMQEHNESELIDIFSQILRGIEFLYQNKILHRDIKPSNILVNHKKVIKIADFGTSKLNKSSEIKFKTLVGTPLFFSPELLEMSLGEEDTYTEKSQIWALGLILYYMFNYEYAIARPADRMRQSLPWTGGKTSDILKNIKTQPLEFKKPERVPEYVRDILGRMLKVKSEQRMSFKQLFSLQVFRKNRATEHPESSHELTATQQCTINYANKQTIDWQLMELLQRQDQSSDTDQEMQEQIRFYQMLLREFADLRMQYADLVCQLERQLLCVSQETNGKGLVKQKGDDQPQSSNAFCQHSDSIHNSEYLQAKKSLPSERLLEECRKFIKENLQLLPNRKAQTSLSQQSRKIIYLVYDMLTLLTFETSWQLKKKSKVTMQGYQRLRKRVSLSTITSRICKASECIKI